ncbi:MAG: hypothetical protein ACRDQ4_21950 [Pseudonocardiaceae bacterium]
MGQQGGVVLSHGGGVVLDRHDCQQLGEKRPLGGLAGRVGVEDDASQIFSQHHRR